MTDITEINDSAHDLRNNIHAFEMALVVLDEENSKDARSKLIEMLKRETEEFKNNLERFIDLVETELEKQP